MSGWIKFHRKLTEWEWYDDIPTFRLFTHLLLTVNYKPTRYHGIDIPVGSRVCGLPSLADQTGLSIRQIRTAIDKLKSTGELTVKSNNKFSIISITNWELYQQDDSQEAVNRHSSDSQPTTSKEGKKVRREECMLGDQIPDTPKIKNSCRIPSNWECSKELGIWAMSEGLSRDEVLKEIDNFIDYWNPASGQKARKHNWDAAFRTWIRNATKWKDVKK